MAPGLPLCSWSPELGACIAHTVKSHSGIAQLKIKRTGAYILLVVLLYMLFNSMLHCDPTIMYVMKFVGTRMQQLTCAPSEPTSSSVVFRLGIAWRHGSS